MSRKNRGGTSTPTARKGANCGVIHFFGNLARVRDRKEWRSALRSPKANKRAAFEDLAEIITIF